MWRNRRKSMDLFVYGMVESDNSHEVPLSLGAVVGSAHQVAITHPEAPSLGMREGENLQRRFDVSFMTREIAASTRRPV